MSWIPLYMHQRESMRREEGESQRGGQTADPRMRQALRARAADLDRENYLRQAHRMNTLGGPSPSPRQHARHAFHSDRPTVPFSPEGMVNPLAELIRRQSTVPLDGPFTPQRYQARMVRNIAERVGLVQKLIASGEVDPEYGVACTRCHATIGFACRSAMNNIASEPHVARIRLAQNLRR